MITHTVNVTVPNAKAEDFYHFMINPTTQRYREWWEGEHLQFYIIKKGQPNHQGDLVFMDEYIGINHRLVFCAKVIIANHPHQIVWQMIKAGLRLPAFVTLTLNDTPQGVHLTHQVQLGFKGLGNILDPFIRLYFNASFQKALTKHCQIEWFKLADYLKYS